MFRQLLVYFIPLAFLSCDSSRIENCDKKTFHYSELPKEVKSVIFENYFKDPHSSNIYSNFKDLNEPYKYYETIEQTFLPWVYEQYLHRIEDGKIFKIEISSEHGANKIVLDDYLFVAKHYNMYITDSSNYFFMRYKLK